MTTEIVPEMKRKTIDEREPETVCNGVEMYLVMIGHRANYSCDLVKIPLKIISLKYQGDFP